MLNSPFWPKIGSDFHGTIGLESGTGGHCMQNTRLKALSVPQPEGFLMASLWYLKNCDLRKVSFFSAL